MGGADPEPWTCCIRVTNKDPATTFTFGQQIRELRRATGMTQRVAASTPGIDFTYLSKIENDRGDPPSEQTIRAMADLHKGDTEQLLALAGKVPASLRERAVTGPEFAAFLRRPPRLSDEKLHDLYESTHSDDG